MKALKPKGGGRRAGGVAKTLAFLLLVFEIGLPASVARAAINVTISGPGGSGSAVLPDAGGAFAVDIPLNRNAVNPLTITAADKHGNVRSAELAITQVSLDQIVVSQVTAERLSTEEVERLVADGTIQLDDPANYNVSEFAIVLTIAGQEVPIQVPIAFPKGEEDPVGYENIPLPWGGDGGGGRPPPPPPPEIIVFLQEFSPGDPGEPVPPPIPGVIIIEGRIKSLKEFFNVRLLLMNTSGIFTLSDVLAELEFPDGGLSHVLPADGLAAFGDILPGTPDQPGALEKEFIIRGDAIGEKRVRVHFGGTVTGPGIPGDDAIPFNGTAETSVEVKGPPQFRVQVQHPAAVTSGVPYELTVEVQNAGELPALYASLELDVSADARLANCTVDAATGVPDCEYVDEPVVQSLGHIQPGERVSMTYTVLPSRSGIISSCVGVSDQNIALQVVVGNIGCVAGHYPPDSGAPAGIPTVTVVPFNNAQGISIDSPVVAFFSERMDHGTIQTGTNGTFNVVDAAQVIVPGQIRIETNLSGRTLAIWQVNDGVLNRLKPGAEYTVYLSQGIRDPDGNGLFNEWISTFQTTTMGVNDTDPPQLTLSIEPPVNPNDVLPGEVVQVNAYAVDQGSGIARVELRMKDLNGTNLLYTLVDQKSVFAGNAPPFRFALDSAGFALGHTIQLLATAYDGMGNARDATLALIVAPSAAPPTIALPPDPAVPVLQGISVTLKPVALTGGVRAVRYHLDGAAEPYKTVTLPPWQASLSTLALAYGAHEVRAVAVDGLGQTGEDTYAFSLVTNPSLPVVSFPGSEDGEVHVTGASFSVRPRVEDEVGVRSVHVYLASPATNLIATNAGPLVIDTAALALGTHHVIVQATNLLGKANDPANPDSVLEFEVVPPPVGAAPAPPVVTSVSPPAGGYATVTGTSSNHARIDIENLDLGGVASVYADASGVFSAGIGAAAGNRLRLVAYDLAQSAYPSAPTNVIVPVPPVLLEIEVRPAAFTLTAPGQHRDLQVWGAFDTGQTNDITSQAAFSSDAPGVVSVNAAGRVVAVSRGNATLTATAGGRTNTAVVFVDIVTLTNLLVAPAEVNLISIGQTQALAVTGQYNNGTSAALPAGNSFVSGDPAIATVDSGGTVTAAGDGLTQVTVFRSGVPPVAVPVRVDTGADPAPTVQILQPLAGASVEPGGLVTVSVRARDATAGVVRVFLSVTGAVNFAETRQLSPADKDTTQVFNFPVPGSTPVGGTIHVRTWADDTSGKFSATGTVAVAVVDASAPQVEILQPVPLAGFGYGDPMQVVVRVADASGVTQVACRVTGAFALSETRTLSPPAADSNVVFQFTVPFGVPYPEAAIQAEAWDQQGYRGQAIQVPVVIIDADLTPPATRITSVSNPGVGTTATVTYEVTDGLADLDHVAIYFRRDGYGTFNRYTDSAGGNPLGKFLPQSGAFGTLAFDSTRMGGDGTYEFYSIGMDQTGNRELAPTNAAGQVVADRAQAFTAGTAWTTISANTDIVASDATYDDLNLRISAATVTVAGAHAFHNVELLNGAVLTQPETTATEEFGLEITAWTLTVDSNSAINVNARGYPGGNRHGNPGPEGQTLGHAAGSTFRSGGSYGGSGAAEGGTPNALYGNLTAPSESGSGGSYGAGTVPGGDGGGRVRINAVNVVLDGAVSANGGNGQGNDAGSGSGGAVYFSVSTLSGRGTATANGGGYQVGGGGGRIAVHYADLGTYDTSLLTALGGDGSGSHDGGNGTVFLKSLAEGGGTLIVDGQGAASSFSTLPIPPGWVFDNIILRNSARVVADDSLVVSNTLSLLTGSILTHSRGQTDGLVVEARRVVIDATSSMDVSGKGYRGGNNSGYPGPQGETLGGQPGSAYRSGGSYGGLGVDLEGTANPAYGHPGDPVHLGSGGSFGAGTVAGGNGGGRVTLVATHSLAVAGAIRANGTDGGGNDAGSGSGGSIRIETSLLRGGGVIQANGGAYQVGGGGGRIAIAYDYFGQPGDDLAGTRNIVARGGQGSRHGSAGTVLLRRNGQTHGDLYIDDETTGFRAARWTPLTHLGFGRLAWLSGDTLGTDGKVPLIPGGLAGLEINPNIAQAQTFTVLDNTATSLTVDVSGGTLLTDVAATGDTYAAVYRFDNVFVRRGGYLVLGDKLAVAGSFDVDEFGEVTHYDATVNFDSRMDITTGTLNISSNAAIRADARGYPGGNRHGNDVPQGQTVGHAAGATYRSGASYGGLGGRDEGAPNAIYGSLTQPADLGSGGSYGAGTTPGGDGGGWIAIRADAARVDGVLSAGGGAGQGNNAGSGSGGTITLDVATLSGAGAIQANGGGYQVAGGGGRIAIRYQSMTFPQAQIECLGGQGNAADGGNGTVFLKQSAQAHGDLVVDGLGAATPGDSTPIPGGYTFDNLTFRNNAQVVADAGLTAGNLLAVQTGSLLTHTLRNEAGLSVTAGRIEVGPTAAIDVSRKGYRGGNRGGYPGPEGETLGGAGGATFRAGASYGGLGGNQDGTRNPIYGDLTNPVDLGSGGSRGAGSVAGGHGGGRMTLVVTGYVQVDGALRANGGTGDGNDAGSGSGGAIRITADELRGMGTIEANGAGYQVAGGGGRIAIRYGTMAFPQAQIECLGGQGDAADGGNGTVFLKQSAQAHGDLIVDGLGATTPGDSTPIPGGYTFNNLTFRNNAQVVADAGLTASNLLAVQTGSILTHTLRNEDGLSISARRIEVGPTAAIDVSRKGYRGGNRGGYPGPAGETLGGLAGATFRSGGSYGGLGANDDGTRNPAYGNVADPVHLGSGGSYGAGTAAGGHGGGRMTLAAAEFVQVDGALRANGGTGDGNDAGSGSGGAIQIATGQLRGMGTIEANGGGYQVPGGGGRIAIAYGTLGGADNDLGGLRNITAFGGRHASRPGSAGTVLLRQTAQANGDLFVDDGYTNATAAAWTPLTHLGFGRSRALSADTLTTDGRVATLPGALVGLKLNPNLAQDMVFTIVANTATTIVVDVSGGTALPDVAAAGDEYAAVYRLDNVRFRRGGFLVLGDRLIVDGQLDLAEYGRLTHYDATATFDSRLELFAGAVNIRTSASINVDARGYPGGNRHGHSGPEGQTTNHAAGSTFRSGGSYGGLGYGLGGTPNPIYGSATAPADLGSGGSYGAGTVPGGDGGGWVSIYAATVTVNGAISSAGGDGQGNDAGSGSGGSIHVRVRALSGTGFIRADGGAYQVPGGGGRIALHFAGASSTTNGLALSAAGGVSGGRVAGAGSIHLNDAYGYVPFARAAGGGTSGRLGFWITSWTGTPGADARLDWVDSAPRLASPAAAYVVEFAPDLLTRTNWILLEGQLSGGEWQGNLPADATRGFIRIRRSP